MKPMSEGEEACTLKDLFAVTPRLLGDKLEPDALLSFAQGQRKKLDAWRKNEQWPRLPGQVAEHVCDFLCPSVVGVFAGAWSKYAELREQAEKTRADPSMSSDVALTQHTFVYEAAPSIELLVNDVVIGTIPFGIEVQWEVSGLVLSLRRGCVEAVRSGQSDCELAISCADTVVWTRKVLAVNLPMILHLSKPLAINK